MPVYRLYFLDLQGRISGVRELDCASDEQAVAHAAAIGEGQAMELWERDRRVKIFSAVG